MKIGLSLVPEYLADGWLLCNPAERQRADGTWEDES